MTTWWTRAILRRGKASARLVWGNEASVLVGDFLLGQAFKMMVDVGSLGALRILSDAAALIAEGEVMQLVTAKNTETTEDDYLAVIDAKTAALFAAAAEVGAAIADRPKSEAAALRSYGRNLGLAFQLVDDALDYAGEPSTLGKSVGDDFREGKITLPVVLCYRRGSAAERAFWRRTLTDGEIGEGRSRRGDEPDEAAQRAVRYRWTGPAITAPSPATRSRSSPTAPPRRRCARSSRSASTARSRLQGRPRRSTRQDARRRARRRHVLPLPRTAAAQSRSARCPRAWQGERLERGKRGKHGPDFRNEICGRRFEIVAARERIGKERGEVAAEIELFGVVARARP